jgi:hypothetical protein
MEKAARNNVSPTAEFPQLRHSARQIVCVETSPGEVGGNFEALCLTVMRTEIPRAKEAGRADFVGL